MLLSTALALASVATAAVVFTLMCVCCSAHDFEKKHRRRLLITFETV